MNIKIIDNNGNVLEELEYVSILPREGESVYLKDQNVYKVFRILHDYANPEKPYIEVNVVKK